MASKREMERHSQAALSTGDSLPLRVPLWKAAGLAFSFISLAALLSPLSRYNLSPVYGSIPSALYHQHLLGVVMILAFLSKSRLKRYLRFEARNLLPVATFWIPVAQCFLFELSGSLGPLFGPVITQLLSYCPALFLAILSAWYALEELDMFSKPSDAASSSLRNSAPIIGMIAVFGFVERTASTLLPQYMGRGEFFTRSGLQMLVASLYALLSRSQVLLLAGPAMIHTIFANPHYHSWSATQKLNGTLSQYNYTLLERRDSLTGYISVLQNQKDQFTVLRCDHSLLGGEWLMTRERKTQGQNRKETIYSVFTMLESVRLVETAREARDDEKRALFIGLGIGTSPTAFIEHGINTTIIELDPVVHEFATKYFDLPTNHTAILSDAIPYVASTAHSQPQSYDYIVHDVFTGGAEPTVLFTLEFLSGIQKLLKDNGVVAINYAGDLTMPPSRLVLNTINAVFPSCRVFRDMPVTESTTSFVNMVVFCTKDSKKPLTFRKPVDRDFLGSLSRRSIIPPSDALEIKIDEIELEERRRQEVDGIVLKTGEEWRIEKYHPEAARRHWQIMRTVLPDEIWENW